MAGNVSLDLSSEHPQTATQEPHAAVRVVARSAAHDQSSEPEHFIDSTLITAAKS